MNPNIINLGIKIVVAGVAAFFLYRDAKARDYNWFMWTLIPIVVIFTPGLFSSIFTIAIILGIYLFSRPKGELTPCPHCKKGIHNILAFCPFCRKPVKRECLHCHETVDWDATRCPHCRSTNLTDS